MSQVVRDRVRKVQANERISEDSPKKDPVDPTNSNDSSKITDSDASLKDDPSTNDPRLRSLVNGGVKTGHLAAQKCAGLAG